MCTSGEDQLRAASRLPWQTGRARLSVTKSHHRDRAAWRRAFSRLPTILAAMLSGVLPATGSAALSLGAALALSAVLAVPAEARAPELSTDLRVRQQELLALTLARPDNLDLAFEYATVSASIGDYEAAISTFERMLIFAPGLPRVQLELGVLYFRLGANGQARQYFEAAISGPNVPDEVRERVGAYLAAIGDAENPTEFQASLLVGLRVQSNATAGPDSRFIDLNGTTFLLDPTSTGRRDVNAYTAATLHWGYDLGTQGDALEADLLAYASRYGDVSRLDSSLVEVTFGPAFNLARFGLDDARLGVYAIASGVRLDHANYSGTLGSGLRAAWRPEPLSELQGKVEFRRRWYNDTAANPEVSERSGALYEGSLIYARHLSAAWTARATLFGDFEEAKVDWRQSWEVGAGAGVTWRFASPAPRLSLHWSASLDAGYIRRIYQGPDPLINAGLAQKDHEGFLKAGLTVPLREDIALTLGAELRRQVSTYDLGTFNNGAASLALVKTF
ncbi:tetratricopeptide repeat protein [Roseibium aestuarii]|uniref:Tetratricopeptide repeat protein n=1 Tax=Roseibium aestuarii TaxID=2600299 RepID=A0ABW4JUX5_9HYPH|nr:hypothetical protein [Roseibium aestuarii]